MIVLKIIIFSGPIPSDPMDCINNLKYDEVKYFFLQIVKLSFSTQGFVPGMALRDQGAINIFSNEAMPGIFICAVKFKFNESSLLLARLGYSMDLLSKLHKLFKWSVGCLSFYTRTKQTFKALAIIIYDIVSYRVKKELYN